MLGTGGARGKMVGSVGGIENQETFALRMLRVVNAEESLPV